MISNKNNLREKTKIGGIIFLISIFVFSNQLSAQGKADLNKIIEKSNTILKVSGSTSESTFTLIDKSGQERKRKTISYTKLKSNGSDNRRMTRFLSPQDAKGTGILLDENSKGDDDISIFLPALKKIRKVSAGGKKDSFVGTDFSYADVIGFKTEDWNYKELPEESIDGKVCTVIEALPKSSKVVTETGYSKRIVKIQKDTNVPLGSDVFDENGDLLKKLKFSEHKIVDQTNGKWWAMRAEVINVQTGHKTIITTENYNLTPDLEDKYFTARFLEKE